MPLYTVKIRWGKENFPHVEINTDEELLVFKAQLFALTGVQPERQKILLKGITVKEENWNSLKLKNDVTFLLVGSKEEDVPFEPSEAPTFLEDMNENQLSSLLELPAGLNNLGNTCYLNATVQCLYSVPELRQALSNYQKSIENDLTTEIQSSLVIALKDLFKNMTHNTVIPPIALLQVLHIMCPRFAEKSNNRTFMQQDANECWVEMMHVLQQKLMIQNNSEINEHKSFINQFFGGEFECKLQCSECPEEPSTSSKETFVQLNCFISQDVKYLLSGLSNKLKETLTKHSPMLGRDAIYVKTSFISRLPAYLTIQFMRFYFKEKEAVNAKILKDIQFPLYLDVFDLCSTELQAKFIPMRKCFQKYEEQLFDKCGNKDKKSGDSEIKFLPFSFPDDPGSNNSGYYKLQAVLTHKGRSSSSGHYVAWVCIKDNQWVMCDDEKMVCINEADILKLSGGGDWHCAYILLYGSRSIPEISDL